MTVKTVAKKRPSTSGARAPTRLRLLARGLEGDVAHVRAMVRASGRVSEGAGSGGLDLEPGVEAGRTSLGGRARTSGIGRDSVVQHFPASAAVGPHLGVDMPDPAYPCEELLRLGGCRPPPEHEIEVGRLPGGRLPDAVRVPRGNARGRRAPRPGSRGEAPRRSRRRRSAQPCGSRGTLLRRGAEEQWHRDCHEQGDRFRVAHDRVQGLVGCDGKVGVGVGHPRPRRGGSSRRRDRRERPPAADCPRRMRSRAPAPGRTATPTRDSSRRKGRRGGAHPTRGRRSPTRRRRTAPRRRCRATGTTAARAPRRQ